MVPILTTLNFKIAVNKMKYFDNRKKDTKNVGLRCFRDLVGSNWLVYSGAHDLLKFETTRTTHAVDQVILHEAFDLNTFDNDVALLKLATPVLWNQHASPVCLPPPGFELPPGTSCVITGWGVSGKRICPLSGNSNS